MKPSLVAALSATSASPVKTGSPENFRRAFDACFPVTSQDPATTILIDIGTHSTSGVAFDAAGAITATYPHDLSLVLHHKGKVYFGHEALSFEGRNVAASEIKNPFANGVICDDGTTAKELVSHIFEKLRHHPRRMLQRSKTKHVIFSIPTGAHAELHKKELGVIGKSLGLETRFALQPKLAVVGAGFKIGGGKAVLSIELGGGTAIVSVIDDDGEFIMNETLTDIGGATANKEIAEALDQENYVASIETIEAIKRLAANGEVLEIEHPPHLEPEKDGHPEQVVFWGYEKGGTKKMHEQWCSVSAHVIRQSLEWNSEKVGRSLNRVLIKIIEQPHLNGYLRDFFRPGGLILSGGVTKVKSVRERIADRLQMERLPADMFPELFVLKGGKEVVQKRMEKLIFT